MCETKARLEGKVAIVTGGSAGIGLAIAKNLASRGARVVLASRNEDKLKKARDEIEQATGNRDIAYRTIDMASLKSVRNFANETVNFEKRLDILINNVGAVGLPDKHTEDGLNLGLQVNYFGGFLLTYLLLPLLKSSAPSRILSSSAGSMYFADINYDHWNDIGEYNYLSSLAASQLAITLFTAELDRQLKGTGVTANTYDPSVVQNTDLFDSIPPVIGNPLKTLYNTVGQTRERVGQQIGYLAIEPKLEKVSGRHFKLCTYWLKHWLTEDANLTRRHWEASKKAVKIMDN